MQQEETFIPVGGPGRKISPSRKSFNTRPKTQSAKPKPKLIDDNGQRDAELTGGGHFR